MIKKVFLLGLLLMMLVAIAGCGENETDVSAMAEQTVQRVEKTVQPMQQEDSSKLRIGLLDINEYEPASTYLYYVLEGLKEDGWLTYDTLPFTETSMDVVAMVEALSEMNLGPYIEFVGDAAYYMDYESEDAIVQSMQEHIDSPQGLDIILAMGTDPGIFMKERDLDVNTLVCMATDPVSAGIISSADNSGDPQLWAQVESLPYERQLEYYYSIIPYEHLGLLCSDPDVVGLSYIADAAEKMGIGLTVYPLNDSEANNEAVLIERNRALVEDGVDAYFLTADLIGSDMDVAAILEPLIEADIPVFVQDGENYVEQGALMLVASTDYVGVGRFVASTIEQVACGTAPGDISGEYVSSPYISINLDTARAIGFQPNFELLLACETIYSSETDQ